MTQGEKAVRFQQLHARTSAFIIPNPWDAGSARMLEATGFEALATTSAGYAYSIGTLDGAVGRALMLEHCTAIARATSVPVSADLENGFGDSPEAAHDTIRLAGATGIVGGSIEDSSGDRDQPIYEIAHAAERIRAAADAARSHPFQFMLTARAENYLHGRPNLADTIRRLQAYQEAGADVLYAPGLTTIEDFETVVKSVDRPVNALMGMATTAAITAEDLSRIGIRRISLGGAMYRAAITGFLRAAHEMREQGTFMFTKEAAKSSEIMKLLDR